MYCDVCVYCDACMFCDVGTRRDCSRSFNHCLRDALGGHSDVKYRPQNFLQIILPLAKTKKRQLGTYLVKPL